MSAGNASPTCPRPVLSADGARTCRRGRGSTEQRRRRLPARKEPPMNTTNVQRRHGSSHGSALAAAGLALGLGVTGCTAGTSQIASTTATTAAPGRSEVTSAAPTPAPTTGTEHYIVVGGRHFAARCDGSGPAVILVADYGRSMDDTGPALHDLSPHAQACLYDRVGVGRSDS